tara:strand:- start:201 stop:443 length:243 start_codon:yes stop_codon:yes gene_type:complete
MIYEVWYKNGVDLDYFGSREAAEMWLEKYIAKLNVRRPRVEGPWTEEDFEIREKEEPVNNKGVVIPGCDWPTGCDYGIGG